MILERRSIRTGFEDRPVPTAVIDRIVECGISAPSSKNAQPWRIHVVTSPRVLHEFADAVRDARQAERYVPIDPTDGKPRGWSSTVVESAEILRTVRLGLFVENRGEFSGGCHAVAEAADAVRHSALIGYGLEMIGLGAAIQNMWLAAQAEGLRGVFMGDIAIASAVIRARLTFDGDLVGALAVGYTPEAPTPKYLAPDRVVRHDVGPRETQGGERSRHVDSATPASTIAGPIDRIGREPS